MLRAFITIVIPILCLSLVVTACGDDTGTSPSKSSTTDSAPVDDTVPEAKTDCSAKGEDLEYVDQSGLPEPVAKTRRTLFLAALALFAMTFVVNTGAELVRQRFRRRAYQL